MGQRFSQVNPEWQRLVNELMKAQDQAKYTHAVHCDRIHLPAGPKLERTVGCFSYALAEPGCVRLHFNSRDQTQESSLSSANRPARQAELSELLSHLRVSAGDNVDHWSFLAVQPKLLSQSFFAAVSLEPSCCRASVPTNALVGAVPKAGPERENRSRSKLPRKGRASGEPDRAGRVLPFAGVGYQSPSQVALCPTLIAAITSIEHARRRRGARDSDTTS